MLIWYFHHDPPPLPILHSVIAQRSKRTDRKVLVGTATFWSEDTCLAASVGEDGLPECCAGLQVKADTKGNLTFTAWASQVACPPKYRGTHVGTHWGLQSCLVAIAGATQWSPEMLLCEAEQDAPLLDLATAVEQTPSLIVSAFSLETIHGSYILDYVFIINTRLKQASQTPQRTRGRGWSSGFPQRTPQASCLSLFPAKS